MQKHWAIIPAAGVGRRMQNSVTKQYLLLNGKTVLEHAVTPFLQNSKIEKIVVCISPRDEKWQHLELSKNSKIEAIEGAETRAASVLNGLLALKSCAHEDDWVIVHDAVRPCLRIEDLEGFIDRVEFAPHSCMDTTDPQLRNATLGNTFRDLPSLQRMTTVGGLMAVPVRDTLKQVNRNRPSAVAEADLGPTFVSNTVDRNTLWCAQTPQMFPYGKLLNALQKVDLKTITDESQAIELTGEKPLLVLGRHDNIKITFPEDLLLAEKILRE